MKKLLGNWELKALAVMAAIIFWFLVVATENTFYTFPEEIPVKAFNVPENLVVAEDLENVTLRLKIDNRETIKNLTFEDFNAYVDLEDAAVGEREVEIEVSSKIADINVVKVDPARITVKIEEKAEKEVPVEYEIISDPLDGYIVKDVSITDERVVIKGPENVLNDIDHASLIIGLEGLDDDIKNTFTVKVLDEEGNEIEGVTADKEEIEAFVDIMAVTDQKIAGVQPTIIGTPQENVWIKSITVEPNFVVLTGEKDVLDSVEFVNTSDIDVSGVSDNSSFNVQVVGLPEGINVDGTSEIKVSIEVDTYDSVDSSVPRKTVKVPVLVRKFKTSQRSISIDPVTVTLVAEGDQEDIDRINSKLNVELDISEYAGNEATVDISEGNLKLPGGVDIVSITPSKVQISWQ
ncbi:YbbR-like domain-containing protein [Patescibacteria group bacterium]